MNNNELREENIKLKRLLRGHNSALQLLNKCDELEKENNIWVHRYRDSLSQLEALRVDLLDDRVGNKRKLEKVFKIIRIIRGE